MNKIYHNQNQDLRDPLNEESGQINQNPQIMYKQPPQPYHSITDQVIPSKKPKIIFTYEQTSDEQALDYLSKGLQGTARKNFIKKVYSIVALQLLFTVFMCILSTYSKGFIQFQIDNFALMYVALGIMIATEITIFCCEAGRKHPYNMVALGIFTLAQAYLVSFIAAVVADANGGAIVVMAACMTLVLVTVLTFYAIFTKTDFTTPWAILMAFITSIILFFVFLFIQWTPVMQTFYCSLGIFVFGLYLIIDTQLIMGHKSFSISMDDYVIAALLIYIDIIQLFLYILSLLSNR